ncbi:hypothetical protein ACIBK8_18075 [Streptomyces sp. NPDC050161]|uniref:hypothetical protein n=1 Tax=Streptomyces sp. NPDC050161 TaxID=3365604 RepID=UPI00379917AC
MAEQFTAAQDALHTFAKSSDERAEKLRAIRSSLGSHKVDREAFGKLPEADEISKDYEERQEDVLETLGSLATLQEKIGEAVTATAQSYQDTDDETVTTMSGGGGR